MSNVKSVNEIASELKEKANGSNVDNNGLVIEISQDEIWDSCDNIIESHNREIEDFQSRYDACVRKFNEVDADRCRIRDENASLRALVKDLSAALNESCDCHLRCDGCDMADESKFDCPEKRYRALVAKAREAIR